MAMEVQDYKISLDKNKAKAESFFPGVAYVDFNRTGALSIWNISKMFEAGRIIPFLEADFLDNLTLRGDNATFYLLGADYYFDSCLWEATRKFHYFPYKVSIELIDIGQSSLTIREVLTNLLDNKEVSTFYGKYVYVDKASKKSKPFPDWHKAKYKAVKASQNIHFESSNAVMSDNNFKVEVLIAPSDTDFNGHTNQASYVRFCMDAAETARQAGYLKGFTNDVCLYPILKLSTFYKGETLAGDNVRTSVWQDDTSLSVLNFAIHKRDKLAFNACITFKNISCSKL